MRYLSYAELLRRNDPPSDLSLYELSIFSQNGEDGVLWEILSRLGIHEGFFVEIGASPNESNCLLLADLLGWHGVFLDASARETGELARKYAASPHIVVVNSFVTPDNLEGSFQSANVPLEFDVLSIDVDGNDYWLWRALKKYRPKVVVIEYNSALGADLKLVQHYSATVQPYSPVNFGASVTAMEALGCLKGYRLVHVDTTGTNLFFVQDTDSYALRPHNGQLIRHRVPNYYLYGLRHRGMLDPNFFLENPE
jgi:hypothetical protein